MISNQHNESHSFACHHLRAAIIHPGALGDCLLTLPLIHFIKHDMGFGTLDFIGHLHSIRFLVGRSTVDVVRSIESIPMHRLFQPVESFERTLTENDPLIREFSQYHLIVSFLGEPDSAFEENLIFTVNCQHGADVIVLPFNPPQGLTQSIASFYLAEFLNHNPWSQPTGTKIDVRIPLVQSTPSDIIKIREILNAQGMRLEASALIVIHPGSGAREKCWHSDNLIAVSETLAQQGASLCFLIGPVEQERLDHRTVCRFRDIGPVLCELELDLVTALLSQSKAFIGNDSGVTHLSGILGQPTISLFGPTNPALYGPMGPNVRIIHDPSPSFHTAPSQAVQKSVLDALESFDILG